MCASARPVAGAEHAWLRGGELFVDAAVALARLGVEGQLAAGASVRERAGELVLEPVEVLIGEGAAERQQLAALDGDEQQR